MIRSASSPARRPADYAAVRAAALVSGVCGGAARDVGEALGLPATLPGGAVEARSQGWRLRHRASDAVGALDLGGTAPQAARHPRRRPRIRQKSPITRDNHAVDPVRLRLG